MVLRKSRVVAIFGLPISNVNMDRAVATIDSRILSGGHYQIATANLDFVRNARKDPALHRVICDCSMVLPDGFPLLMAARFLGRPLMERVTGVDLTPELAKLSAAKGYGIFLLGSTDENAQAAMRAMSESYPGVKFVGQYAPPPAALGEMDDDEIVRRIHEAKPEILLVAFGNPKQEFWIHKNLERLQVPVAIGIGGTLEMIAGAKKRAPRVLQALHMEWAFRLLLEPLRLLPRYAKDLWALAKYFPGEIVANRLQWRQAQGGAIHVDMQPNHRVATIRGAFTGHLCGMVRDMTTEAVRHGCDVTLDLAEVTSVEADGLGCLLDLRRGLEGSNQNLYIVGVSNTVLRVVDAASLRGLLNLQEVRNAPAVRTVAASA